jgi:hypothetical protein
MQAPFFMRCRRSALDAWQPSLGRQIVRREVAAPILAGNHRPEAVRLLIALGDGRIEAAETPVVLCDRIVQFVIIVEAAASAGGSCSLGHLRLHRNAPGGATQFGTISNENPALPYEFLGGDGHFG